MSFEIGSVAFSLFCSGPPEPKRYEPTQIAIQLSMIVVITSWAPTVALRKPAIPAQIAPASVAADDPEQDVRERRHARQRGADPDRDVEADEVLALAADVEHAAAERERDREPGQDQRRRLQQRLREVVRRGVDRVGRRVEEPVQAGAVEDVAVGGERVVAGRGDDDAADQERDDAP